MSISHKRLPLGSFSKFSYPEQLLMNHLNDTLTLQIPRPADNFKKKYQKNKVISKEQGHFEIQCARQLRQVFETIVLFNSYCCSSFEFSYILNKKVFNYIDSFNVKKISRLITVVYRVTTPTTTPTQNVRTLTTQNTSVYYLPSLIPRYHVTKDVEIVSFSLSLIICYRCRH